MSERFDVAIVGAGIVGLAHAYHFSRLGQRVVVLERNPRAQGASVRNFGMLWPIGQPEGEFRSLANRSVELWLELLESSGLWFSRCGSLHLAYHDTETAVLEEFHDSNRADCELLSVKEIETRYPVVRSADLRIALFSRNEVTVDPREIISKLPSYLTAKYGVQFHFGTPALGYDCPRLNTATGEFIAERVVVCTGADFRELAPEAFANTGLVPCKLQMMRTPPMSQRLGTMLAAGLTLRHYKAFGNCPSLPELIRRLDCDLPDYHRHGIHVMVSQNGLGELILGDSHEYGDAIEPFDKPEIDELILSYLRTFLRPDVTIAARWQGIYVKHPSEPFVIAHPRPGMTAVTGLGGAGMTLSFGLAERVVSKL